jgi:hypothetical protein
VEPDPKPGLFTRLLQFLGLQKRPPDIGVREPRRPVPSASGGAVSLEPPDRDE